MSKIWPSPIEDYAYVVPPRGVVERIVMFLHGRGEQNREITYPWEQRLVDEGSIFFYPYYGPWGCLTPEVSLYLDDLLDRLLDEVMRSRGQTDRPELILAGGSMGGHAALQHAIHTRQKFARIFASAPVTDLQACFDYLPEVRRSMSIGLLREAGSPQEILRRHSPISCIEQKPELPLMIFHGERDRVVPIEQHFEIYCSALRAANHPVVYERLPGGHCEVERESKWDYIRHTFLVTGNTTV